MLDTTKLGGITSKWPQCVITGKKLTKEQAREVIIKTDLFFTSAWPGGNDEKYDIELRNRLNMPTIRSWATKQEDKDTIYDLNEKWMYEHGCLTDLDHLENNWISSCYVGGPNGWCHIDGTIHSNKNIGKWPSWNDVIFDLKQLGAAFPFLDMTIHIIDCESGSGWEKDDEFFEKRVCLGGIHLCNGELENAELIDPFSDVCKPIYDFSGWHKISEKLKSEVASVVIPVEESYFESNCPSEHIFKIEEAIEYFGEI